MSSKMRMLGLSVFLSVLMGPQVASAHSEVALWDVTLTGSVRQLNADVGDRFGGQMVSLELDVSRDASHILEGLRSTLGASFGASGGDGENLLRSTGLLFGARWVGPSYASFSPSVLGAATITALYPQFADQAGEWTFVPGGLITAGVDCRLDFAKKEALNGELLVRIEGGYAWSSTTPLRLAGVAASTEDDKLEIPALRIGEADLSGAMFRITLGMTF